jgi:COMPASS component SWD1
VCDMRKEYKSRVELLEILIEEGNVDEDDENNGNARVRYDSRCSLKPLSYLVHFRFPMTVARFDPSGKFIFIGTASGKVLVFNTRTKIVWLSSSS